MTASADRSGKRSKEDKGSKAKEPPRPRRSMPAGAEAVRAERAARRAERAARAGGARGDGAEGDGAQGGGAQGDGARAGWAQAGTADADTGKPGGAKAAAVVPDTGEGVALIRATWIGTAVFILGAVVAALVPDARFAVAILDVALFLGGCALFFWALAVAAGRSREVEIGLWSLFLLEGVAPSRVRVLMLSPIGIEIAVALSTAWIAGPLAFGILVPVWALGCSGLWGAKYGRFGPRVVQSSRRRPAGGADES